MKDKTNTKIIVITAVTTVLIMLAIFFGLVFLVGAPAANELSENEITKTSKASEKPIPNIKIYDEANALEGLIDKEFIIEELLPTIGMYFDYTNVEVGYNNETSELGFWLTFTDESFGKFISEIVYDDNKDKTIQYLYMKLSEAEYLISQKSMQSIIDGINEDKEHLTIDSLIFQLASESTPEDKILFNIDNDGVTSFLDLY